MAKIAISVPDDTLRRVDLAAARLGISRSAFFAHAAEQALDMLEDDGTTGAINRAVDGLPADHEFAEGAAAALNDVLGEHERDAQRPPVADVLARARSRPGGADGDAIVTAIRSGRDRG